MDLLVDSATEASVACNTAEDEDQTASDDTLTESDDSTDAAAAADDDDDDDEEEDDDEDEEEESSSDTDSESSENPSFNMVCPAPFVLNKELSKNRLAAPPSAAALPAVT